MARQKHVVKFSGNQLFIRVCYLLCVNPRALAASVFYHHHEENEASYGVWLFCSKYVDYSLFTLSE